MRQSGLIAIDVSNSSVKVMQLDAGNKVAVFGSSILEEGTVENGVVMNEDSFAEALKETLEQVESNILRDDALNLRALLCLPESKLFSYHCIIPEAVSRADEKKYISTEAEKIIPFNFEALYWDYHVATERDIRNATLIAVKKTDLDNYVKAFARVGIRPVFVGGEMFALGKALLPEPSLKEDHIILDIGAHSTTLGFFGVDAVPNASVLIPYGGDYFTEQLAEQLNVPVAEAEKLKRKYGVKDQSEDERVSNSLRDILQLVIDDILEAKVFFENKTGNSISSIFVAGGSALMPGLDSLFSTKMGVTVQIANPIGKLGGYESFGNDTETILLSNVIGLALAARNVDFSHINLLTQYEKEKGSVEGRYFTFQQVVRMKLDRVKQILQKAAPVSSDYTPQRVVLVNRSKFSIKLLLTLLFLLGAVSLLVFVAMRYL